VAVDFSADSDAALLWASRHADAIGAPLRVLHVVHDPAEAAGFYREDAASPDVTMSEVAERMMEEYLAKMRDANPGLTALQTAESELVSGLPPGRIVEVAERDGVQIIVIGSRGRTGLAHILLGSVAERVAQLAPVPVVVVKRPPES
jgi:nucleotide-binding universal stress UspA family protein